MSIEIQPPQPQRYLVLLTVREGDRDYAQFRFVRASSSAQAVAHLRETDYRDYRAEGDGWLEHPDGYPLVSLDGAAPVYTLEDVVAQVERDL